MDIMVTSQYSEGPLVPMYLFNKMKMLLVLYFRPIRIVIGQIFVLEQLFSSALFLFPSIHFFALPSKKLYNLAMSIQHKFQIALSLVYMHACNYGSKERFFYKFPFIV